MKKVVSILLALAAMFTMSVTSFAALRAKAGTASWTSKDQWYLWSQGASSSSTVRKVGCRTVAYAKMIAEAGYADFSNPDEFSTYLVNNGYVNSRYQETTAGKGPDKYTNGAIKFCGKEALTTYNSKGQKVYVSKAEANRKIMSLLNEGYYLCLMGPSHTTYVLREASLKAGKALISDSWANWAYSSYANEIAYTKYNYAKFTNIWKFKVQPKTNNINDGEEVTVQDGVYNIRTSNSAYYINVKDNGTANTTNVDIRTHTGVGSQDFYIYRESNGWYKIRHIYSRKSLDVSGAVAGNGTNIQLWDDFDADAQRWKFYKTGDGLCIKNALGYYIDVSNGSFTNGTNIQTWQKNGTSAQRFYLEKVSGYGMISYDVDVDLAIHRTMDYKDSSMIGTVPEGQIVRISERNGKYAYIRYSYIIEGWCSGKYVLNV